MKKITSVFLCLAVLISVFALSGCAAKETMKFGVGVYSKINKNTDALGSENGVGEADITGAAVLLNDKGKIVDCFFDSVSPTVEYNAKGEAVPGEKPVSKYALGEEYKMSESNYDANGDGTVKEWYEQADILANFIKGKTVDEVNKIIAAGGRGNDDLMSAGCTIVISPFVAALEKAVAKAEDVAGNKDMHVELLTSAERKDTNAADGVKGIINVDTTFSAKLTDKSGKEISAKTEKINTKFEFDQTGKGSK